MKTASWVLLTIVGVLTLLASLGSTYLAYVADPGRDLIVPSGTTVSIKDVADWKPDAAQAMRGRRATAAAFAAAFATLMLFVVLGPYRRREVWSWWAVLAATLVYSGLSLLRVPALGTRLGAGPGLVFLTVAVVALLLDVSRLKAAGAGQ
ncbi:MAG: hypothetical protein HY317_04920 [Acidobacteria bacterium]|nr:hypothetical protein [Acidobacteriota bacterium]